MDTASYGIWVWTRQTDPTIGMATRELKAKWCPTGLYFRAGLSQFNDSWSLLAKCGWYKQMWPEIPPCFSGYLCLSHSWIDSLAFVSLQTHPTFYPVLVTSLTSFTGLWNLLFIPSGGQWHAPSQVLLFSQACTWRNTEGISTALKRPRCKAQHLSDKTRWFLLQGR